MLSVRWSIFSLVGHPGFDHISGPHLHDDIWSVQTLQKVCPVLLLLLMLTVWIWFSNVSICVAVRIMGSHLKMWPTWSTTPSSDQSSVLLSALRTLGKYVTCSGSCHRCSAAVLQTQIHILSCFSTFRWSWPQMCLEVTAPGYLSLMILERVSPVRNCPLSPSCRSLIILKIPMYWWPSVIR